MPKRDGNPILIGTRASKLAMWQAEHVASRIAALPGAPQVELVRIKTTGDQILYSPLSKLVGRGFFTREIERALLDGKVDLAVHSLKDVETSVPAGLSLAAILERADPRDVLIGPSRMGINELPVGAIVGTSSLRRRALLARLRPDVEIRDLRGNVSTRIQKFLDGDYDALILAAAGVIRLGLEKHIAEYLPPDRFYPAVSQGAVAVQIRDTDDSTRDWIEPLDHHATRLATKAERAFLRRIEGGCQVPVGALATVSGSTLSITGAVCSLDGAKIVEGSLEGPAEQCEETGRALAEDLLNRGGEDILDGIRK